MILTLVVLQIIQQQRYNNVLEVDEDEYGRYNAAGAEHHPRVRPMSASEVAAYAAEIAKGIRTILESEPEEEDFESGENTAPACDPKRSIKENSIICLECGRSFRVLTIRHLRTHGLDARTYKEKYGFKKNTPLACKSLIRVRRKKMNDMRLWTRKKNVPEGQPEEAPKAKAE